MPTYIYKCAKCVETFTIRHLISEKVEDCEKCGAVKSLKKDYSTPINLKKKQDDAPAKTGTVTKKFIEEAREDLRGDKKELSNKEYEP